MSGRGWRMPLPLPSPGWRPSTRSLEAPAPVEDQGVSAEEARSMRVVLAKLRADVDEARAAERRWRERCWDLEDALRAAGRPDLVPPPTRVNPPST